MVIKKALVPHVRCSNCRLALLKAFISPSGLFIRNLPIRRCTTPRSRNIVFRRSLVTSRLWRSDFLAQRETQDVISDVEDARNEDPIADLGETHASASSTPWYLQVETPQRISNPLLERHRIPELPPDPPPLLKPMLEHISIDLGLDDLTVFDLRNIDPPPALGANLLMILGTARSEKHLHVSADRFCRWLKVTHKLSPYADGLLGRGELKLKLRRKARRARLLSNVGSSETGNADDGIRTGWICVNIGTIEDGKNPVEGFAGQEGYVGFGSEAGGAKVVVQMLTQEKRDELDLEDLWGKMVKRHERKESRISGGQEGHFPDQEVGQSSLPELLAVSNSRFSPSASLPKPPVINCNQVRLYPRRSLPLAADINSLNIQYEGPEPPGDP